MIEKYIKIEFVVLLFLFQISNFYSQTNYNSMANWAFHPNKPGTLIDGFNLNIAVIDQNLATSSVIEITNNSMNDTGVDVFFIHPTILENMASYNTIDNVPISNQNTLMVAASIRGQAGLLSKYGRMFAPRYRQATPPTFLNSTSNSIQAIVLGNAYNDVKDAFLNYLNNYNNGNKIIIASHSQGAYLAGFLLKDIFDSNPELQQKLVVAVIAGITSNYSHENIYSGGWWQNIPFCSQQNECGCVMNWKSFKEGQIPPTPINSHPCLNPEIINNGWANNQLNLELDTIKQDSLYYSNTSKPLRNFITLRSNVNYGGTAGYVAFDSLYSIKHLRSSTKQVGFVIDHTPKPNDQRPNFLLDEESNSTFATTGYHQKDYNIYTWALLEQIDLKLNNCGTILNIPIPIKRKNSLILYPNPANDFIYIKNDEQIVTNELVTFIDSIGKIVLSKNLNQDGGISIRELQNGFYLVKTTFGTIKLIVSH